MGTEMGGVLGIHRRANRVEGCIDERTESNVSSHDRQTNGSNAATAIENVSTDKQVDASNIGRKMVV